jgi:quinol monooxygenase YgiN
MILSTIRMIIPRNNRAEALKILSVIAEQCRDKNLGCIRCHIYEDLEEPNALIIQEAWRTDKDLDVHIRSDEYRKLLLLLEMSSRQPEIQFDTISNSTGIETIERARLHGR